jgi:hypothetical protein
MMRFFPQQSHLPLGMTSGKGVSGVRAISRELQRSRIMEA